MYEDRKLPDSATSAAAAIDGAAERDDRRPGHDGRRSADEQQRTGERGARRLALEADHRTARA
jgi:hypothetical protein